MCSVKDETHWVTVDTAPQCSGTRYELAKNCELGTHGVSTYQALLAQQPPILQDCKLAPARALADAKSDPTGSIRHIHRLRADAMGAII